MKKRLLSILMVLCLAVSLVTPVVAVGEPTTEGSGDATQSDPIPGGTGNTTETTATLAEGVNIISAGVTDTTYNIGEGQVVMIANQGAETPITFTNCTFNLSGGTVRISGDQDGIQYNNGETVTKLFISGNVTFENCLFTAGDDAYKTTTQGNDAAIYFFDGNINLNRCTLTAEGYNGQFLGLYGSQADNKEAVTFTDSIISTEGNKNGWSYAMYSESVLKLNHSSMTATGMTMDTGNTNAFYSGDKKYKYDAIYIENYSIVDFHDNQAGGFAPNNVNIYVNDSTINVSDNAGNACNSGYWIVDNSTITMNGNRGGHAMSCNGFDMTSTTLEILHNGYAGVYINQDSSLTNCTVDIRCNGENLLSYSALDITLNTHNLTIDDCTSKALEGVAWLGGVGRTGAVITTEGSSVVAHDLSTHSIDNLKSSCSPVLTNANVVLNTEADEHTLLLNPFMQSDYARGNAENTASNNDADLFKDDHVTELSDVLGADKAKIGALTDAQLSHHKYDWNAWNAGQVKYNATETTYGAMAYPCTNVCSDYTDHTNEHPHSFNCAGTYVYAPLVGLAFDANAGSDHVTNMPENQTSIAYNGTGTPPKGVPVRYDDSDDWSWVFTGWYTDPGGKEEFDFSNTNLTKNWTVVYAGWKKVETGAGTLAISKTVVDGDLNQDFTFQVDLTDLKGNVLTGEYQYVGSKTGSISSGETITLSNGQTVVINALPVNANYTVTEIDAEGYTTTISGHDSTDPYFGTAASGTILDKKGASVHFTNVLKQPGLDVDKELMQVNGETYTEGRVSTGDDLTYTITVKNTGNTTLSDISVVDTLPKGLQLTGEGAVTEWTIDTLAPEASETVILHATVLPFAEGSTLANTVMATADDLAAQDTETVSVNVNYVPDPDPTPDPTPTPDPDPGDKPELNTEDHYAYIVGYEDGSVQPEGDITRAEVATIFFRLLTDESRDAFWSQTNDYTDVPADAWYNNAVSTLTNAGILDGYEDGTFKPNGNITRAEFATIAVRFFEATYDGGDLFSDIAGHWAQDYINEAANAGIVDGYPDGTFRPQQYITRAEAMTMVNRTIDRHPDADHLLDDMIVWPDNPETAWYYEQVQEATNSHEYTMNTDDEQNPYEIWTELLPNRDWSELEKAWSDANDGAGSGEVV